MDIKHIVLHSLIASADINVELVHVYVYRIATHLSVSRVKINR